MSSAFPKIRGARQHGLLCPAFASPKLLTEATVGACVNAETKVPEALAPEWGKHNSGVKVEGVESVESFEKSDPGTPAGTLASAI